ncbi:hypothetical protein [Paenibacillus koleovorans]|uniref:hypothetical protein n=1 Tax=Paenibacillus koleovorans TaxID=121608 RepID=UPI000FD95CCE|nr:hypothetical protein [Paenibacillus koleovorans]
MNKQTSKWIQSSALIDLIEDIKQQLHLINHCLPHEKRPYVDLDLPKHIQALWESIHQFRMTYFPEESDLYYKSLQKVAGHCFAYRESFLSSTVTHEAVIKEYLVLRRKVSGLEKDIVKQFYYWDTGIHSKRILAIPRAAVVRGKSEITIRRYIKGKKVRAYKLIKIWWVPIEEVINKGGREK